MFRSPHRRRETGRGTECPFDLLVCCAERCPAPEESADRRTAARAQGRTGLPNFSHPTRSAISSSSQGGRGGPRRGDGAVRAPPVHVLPPAVPVTRATGAPSSLCARGQPQKAADDWVGGVSSTRLTPRAPYGLPPPYPLRVPLLRSSPPCREQKRVSSRVAARGALGGRPRRALWDSVWACSRRGSVTSTLASACW